MSARFRIVNFIAAGGMGEVYKAEDLLLDRIVALKFLPKELAEDGESLDRFLREAKAASVLNHPNICTVYDFGEDAGRTFIAMEYLEGETLSARIQRGPLSAGGRRLPRRRSCPPSLTPRGTLLHPMNLTRIGREGGT